MLLIEHAASISMWLENDNNVNIKTVKITDYEFRPARMSISWR
jgi:hypothetical protein